MKSVLTAIIALGTFYALGLHAYWFPIFRGEYIRAENVTTKEVRDITIYAGVNVENLAISLAISALVAVALPALIGKVGGFVKRRVQFRIGVRPTVPSVDANPATH